MWEISWKFCPQCAAWEKYHYDISLILLQINHYSLSFRKISKENWYVTWLYAFILGFHLAFQEGLDMRQKRLTNERFLLSSIAVCIEGKILLLGTAKAANYSELIKRKCGVCEQCKNHHIVSCFSSVAVLTKIVACWFRSGQTPEWSPVDQSFCEQW